MPEEWFGLGIVARMRIKKPQVVENLSSGRAFRAEHLLVNFERLLIERFGLGVSAHLVIETR